MLTIRFYPESDRAPEFATAAAAYQRQWDADGGRVVACLEALTGLRFAETLINALIWGGPGDSHPLHLHAGHDAEAAAGLLVHELGHRLLSGNRPRLGLPPARRDRPLENHQFIDLFLFDAWTDLYGEVAARRLVEVERGFDRSLRQPFYGAAWDWALALDRPGRAAELQARLGRRGPGGGSEDEASGTRLPGSRTGGRGE